MCECHLVYSIMRMCTSVTGLQLLTKSGVSVCVCVLLAGNASRTGHCFTTESSLPSDGVVHTP